MSTSRLRMIAGPNGSGKSTFLEYLRLRTAIPLGQCQNPDEVEDQIRRTGQLDLKELGLDFKLETLRGFLRMHPLGEPAWGERLSLSGNILAVKPSIAGGYFAAVFCDFIRRNWVAAKQTFTFETVMSSPDKLDLLKVARESGYRNYLYFICTDSAKISLARVAVRVAAGGHGVQREKVVQRYVRSLKLLPAAIALSSRAYIFDNSEASHSVVAEYQDGELVSISKNPPEWFVKFVLDVAAR